MPISKRGTDASWDECLANLWVKSPERNHLFPERLPSVSLVFLIHKNQQKGLASRGKSTNSYLCFICKEPSCKRFNQSMSLSRSPLVLCPFLSDWLCRFQSEHRYCFWFERNLGCGLAGIWLLVDLACLPRWVEISLKVSLSGWCQSMDHHRTEP